MTVSPYYEPKDKEFKDNIFITNSMTELSHFEKETENVLYLYKKIFG
jgi:RAB protein geranylgeranyltransferase component A